MKNTIHQLVVLVALGMLALGTFGCACAGTGGETTAGPQKLSQMPESRDRTMIEIYTGNYTANSPDVPQ